MADIEIAAALPNAEPADAGDCFDARHDLFVGGGRGG